MAKTTTFNLTAIRKTDLFNIYRKSIGKIAYANTPWSTEKGFRDNGYIFYHEIDNTTILTEKAWGALDYENLEGMTYQEYVERVANLRVDVYLVRRDKSVLSGDVTSAEINQDTADKWLAVADAYTPIVEPQSQPATQPETVDSDAKPCIDCGKPTPDTWYEAPVCRECREKQLPPETTAPVATAQWTPNISETVRIKSTGEVGKICRILTVMGIKMYNIDTANGHVDREFYWDEIEPVPAPIQPLAELERLRKENELLKAALTRIEYLSGYAAANYHQSRGNSYSEIWELCRHALGMKLY